MDTSCIEGILIPAGALPGRNSPSTPETNSGNLSIGMPPVFRVVSIARLPVNPRLLLARAELFHERATLTVTWLDHELGSAVAENALVSICWMGKPVSIGDAVRVKRLQFRDRPDPTINLFDTVPHHWACDREQIRTAAERWNRMSHDMRKRFNALFWDSWRFRQYFADRSMLGDRSLNLPTASQ